MCWSPAWRAAQPAGLRRHRRAALKPVLVDQSPIGRNPRSNPATYTKLADMIRDLFAAGRRLFAVPFLLQPPRRRLPDLRGLGAVEVAMRYLPSTWMPCADCDGERFTDEVLAVRLAVPPASTCRLLTAV